MSGVVADTHALVWYLRDPPMLSADAVAALDEAVASGALIHLSAISIVEIIYLVERGRLPDLALVRLIQELDRLDSGMSLVPVDRAVAHRIQNIPRDLVPDMPDRIIGATALHLNLPLVTKDARLRASFVVTIW